MFSFTCHIFLCELGDVFFHLSFCLGYMFSFTCHIFLFELEDVLCHLLYLPVWARRCSTSLVICDKMITSTNDCPLMGCRNPSERWLLLFLISSNQKSFFEGLLKLSVWPGRCLLVISTCRHRLLKGDRNLPVWPEGFLLSLITFPCKRSSLSTLKCLWPGMCFFSLYGGISVRLEFSFFYLLSAPPLPLPPQKKDHRKEYGKFFL